jgi:hypothetical protein
MPHGFFAQCPCFRAGQGLKFNKPYAYFLKSEGGQAIFRHWASFEFDRQVQSPYNDPGVGKLSPKGHGESLIPSRKISL